MDSHNVKRVLVVGELNIDLIVTGLKQMPVLGQELICSGFERVMGSSSAIFAVKLAHLGPQVDFIGLIGDDDEGHFVVEQLRANGIGTHHIVCRSDVQTGVTISLSFATDRAMITYPGAMTELAINDINLTLLSQYDHLHVASYFLQQGLQPGLKTLFQRTRQEGLTISFDTGWDPHAAWGQELYSLLQYVDIFFPNRDEARALTNTEDDIAALRTLSKAVRQVVIKLGQQGALTLDEVGRPLHVPGFPVTVVDTTGAGDSFNAGFVYAGLFQKRSLLQAMRFANACGALAVSSVGGATEAPSAAEVEAFISRQGNSQIVSITDPSTKRPTD
jgi:sugar/nucleoside kinase (ribokinase family)